MIILKMILRWILRITIVVGLSGLLYIGTMVGFEEMYSKGAYKKHYEEMFDKIGRESGQNYPNLLISDAVNINAYTTQDNIIITQGMIDFIDNDNELALVMGHEIAHYILKHVFVEDPEDIGLIQKMIWGLQKEENADKLGAFLAMQAGYDVCSGREVWKRFKETHGDVLENVSHPTDIFRYVNLRLPWCEGDL